MKNGNKMKDNCPTIFPYYGGKYILSRKLVPMLHRHTRYVEVFFGGGSMFFRKDKAKINILNDLHNDVINLYISVAEDFNEFKRYAKHILLSRTLHENFRKHIHENKSFDIPDVKRAAMYFFVLKTAFNKNPFLPLSKDARWNDGILDDLEASRLKLQDTYIECMDFRKLFDKYKPDENDMWYLDPPYVAATDRNDYYIHSFKDEDHGDLKTMCDDIDKTGGKFMVSYDNRPITWNTYRHYNIQEIPIKYAGQLHSDEKKIELVITNYIPKKQQLSLFEMED